MDWTAEKWKAVSLDVLERAGWSAGQVFFATLLAGGMSTSVADLPWKYASVLAVSAALGSVLLTTLQYLGKWTDLTFWPDLGLRLAKTFVASLLASVAASKVLDITTFDWKTAFNVAGLATLAALAKGLLARGGGVRKVDHQKRVIGADPPGGPAPEGADVLNPSTLPTDVYLAAVGSRRTMASGR